MSIHIMELLKEKKTSYASPMSSDEIGLSLNVTPSYIRKKVNILKENGLIGVRKGPGGGYFIKEGMVNDESNSK